MVLAAVPRLDRLTTLSLHQCNVSNAGIAALAASPQLVRLRVLRLAGSLITDKVVDTLVASATLAGLRHLDLQNCVFITTNGAQRLRARFGRRLPV